MAADSKPTIVLIRGAFADASGWSAVFDALTSQGYTVYAPANPLRGVAGDGEYIRTFISTIDGPVVLAGQLADVSAAQEPAAGGPSRACRFRTSWPRSAWASAGSGSAWPTTRAARSSFPVMSSSDVASDIWAVHDTFAEAMASAYRDAAMAQVLRAERERSALVAALLEGRVLADTTVWDIAGLLLFCHPNTVRQRLRKLDILHGQIPYRPAGNRRAAPRPPGRPPAPSVGGAP